MVAIISAPVLSLSVSLIDESPLNPRAHWRDLDELAASLRIEQLDAIVVRPHPTSPGRFELADGARRLRAARLGKLPTLEAKVCELTDDQMMAIILGKGGSGNVDPLTPLEEAAGYEKAMKLFGLTLQQAAARYAKTPTQIHRRLSLLRLPKEAREALQEGLLPERTAWLIARVPGEKSRDVAAAAILHSEVHGGVMPSRAAQLLIEQTVCRPLAGAPFDVTDAALLPAAGACARWEGHKKVFCGVCPFHADTDKETYGDIRNPHTCMMPECYARKVAAARERVLAKCITPGKHPLPAEENAEVFPEGENGISTETEYVLFSKPPPADLLKAEVNRPPSWRELLGDRAKVYVGFDQAGRAVELVKVGEAMAAVEVTETAIFSEELRRRYTLPKDRAGPAAAEKKPAKKSVPDAPAPAAPAPNEPWMARCVAWIRRVLEALPAMPPGLQQEGAQLVREVKALLPDDVGHAADVPPAVAGTPRVDELKRECETAAAAAGLKTASLDRICKVATGGRKFGELETPEHFQAVLRILTVKGEPKRADSEGSTES